MAVFLFVAMIAALVLVGIGAVLAVVALIVLAVLLGVGIVSASSLIALANRRLSSGFQAFFLLLGTVAGLFAGIVLGVVLVFVFPQKIDAVWTVVAGAAGGLVTGVCVALLFNFLWLKVVGYFMKAGQGRFEVTEAAVIEVKNEEQKAVGH
jgi:hypothetical protein